MLRRVKHTSQREHSPKTSKCKHKFVPAVCSTSSLVLLLLFVKKRQGERAERDQITLGEKQKMEEVKKIKEKRDRRENIRRR